MVVYSVLTTNSDSQYVRVYSSYLPPDNDPTKNPDEVSVKDAQVSITDEGGAAFSFHPITLPRPPGGRYSGDITAYAAYPFRAGEGKTYTLTVTSLTFGTVTAKTTVPDGGTVAPINPTALANPCCLPAPCPVSPPPDFGVSALLSPDAKGFLVRIYIDYLRPAPDGAYQPRRIELPMRRDVISGWQGFFKEVYPYPMLRSSSVLVRDWSTGKLTYRTEERVPYNSKAFCQKVDDLYLSGLEGCVQFEQAVFYLVQFDSPLWNYYKIANAFQDEYSVRTDEPDYTDIKNGVGVFGSMAVDSTVWPYLPRIIPYHVPQGTAGCQ
jgi:hypothetical protein